MNPHQLLTLILNHIEQNLKLKQDICSISQTFNLSTCHLQRIFKFAFDIPIISYIRLRKLSASIEYLLNTDMNIIDIAYEFGFEHEQTYIRAFKREYNITPGELRRNRDIVEIKPPLNLICFNELQNGFICEPQIVIVPQFYVVGKLYKVSKKESNIVAPQLAKNFFFHEKSFILNSLNPHIYIGLTRVPEFDTDFTYYLPSVQTNDLKNIPFGFKGDIFETSICAKFKYIGNHHYTQINSNLASKMYQSIFKFFEIQTEYQSYFNLHFERIDTKINDKTYCLMEWFAPLIKR